MIEDFAYRDHLSLSELTSCVRLLMRDAFPETCRVVAEVAEIRSSHAGHWYLTLVERGDTGVVAQMDGVIWADNQRILRDFQRETGSALGKGMQVLFTARVNYHDVYGLKLFIEALDAAYTIGQMARQRREVIERLRAEGLVDRNRSLEFPLVTQRIAVVSSRNAAGYQDFADQLARNPRGFALSHMLFNATMQGDGAEASMVSALQRIRALAGSYDVVAIVRGGGSQVDLSCFDGYDLARAIAGMPLPVVTGIGHERDDTVADLVAHTRVKTPTAAAELLIARCERFEDAVLDAWNRVVSTATDTIVVRLPQLEAWSRRLVAGAERQAASAAADLVGAAHRVSGGATRRAESASTALSRAAFLLHSGASREVAMATASLEAAQQRFAWGARSRIERSGLALEGAAQRIADLDPRSVLRRGYSITRREGKALRDASMTRAGETIETVLYRGRLQSAVVDVEVPDGEG